jgi:metal-responsive CopG/Arc/MetJ family transcriptional regulator
MKIKTSITLSEEVLREIDQISGESRNRSAFIENAIQDYLKKRAKKISADRDLEILNRNSKRLNREAEDVLSFQVEL